MFAPCSEILTVGGTSCGPTILDGRRKKTQLFGEYPFSGLVLLVPIQFGEDLCVCVSSETPPDPAPSKKKQSTRKEP